MKSFPIILLLLIILVPIASSERPEYNFPSSIFDELPEYPDDLIEISELFIQNKINITQIPSSYYLQPEFYSSWFSVCDTFYKENRTHYGIYGFNIYPSRYTIFTEKNSTFYITAFMNNNFGIGVKTGVSINIIYDNSIKVEQKEPGKSYFLLDETFPKFKNNWVIPLVLKIDILENKNASIIVYCNKPPEEIHQQWQNEYGLQYATVEKLNSKVPQLTIEIFTPSEKEVILQQQGENSLDSLYLIIIFFIILIIVILSIIHEAYRKWKEKQNISS